jgi:hypothetical protein
MAAAARLFWSGSPLRQVGPPTGTGKDPQMPAEKKTVTIVINGRPQTVEKDEISYEEIVAWSGVEMGENIEVTVSYTRGDDRKPKGTLGPGDKVKAKDGMIFNVTATNKS